MRQIWFAVSAFLVMGFGVTSAARDAQFAIRVPKIAVYNDSMSGSIQLKLSIYARVEGRWSRCGSDIVFSVPLNREVEITNPNILAALSCVTPLQSLRSTSGEEILLVGAYMTLNTGILWRTNLDMDYYVRRTSLPKGLNGSNSDEDGWFRYGGSWGNTGVQFQITELR